MTRQLALTVLLAGLSPITWAQTPPDGYPDPQCKRPSVSDLQIKKTTSRSNMISDDARFYNTRIKAFNRDAAAYNACMHAYIDTANRDVKTVQDKANAELKQVTERANASMKDIQDKIRQAATDANSVGAELEAETAKLRK